MSLLNSLINKNIARYLIGIAILNEGFIMAVAKADYQNLYKNPIKRFSEQYELSIEAILMALITSLLLGGGILTMSNNKTGL